MIRTQKVRLYPNQKMKKVLDDLCDYRRYCWNQGLALWNDMYDSALILEDKTLKPSERKVRDELVANKEDWQYQLSARCLQLAIDDLGKAWKNFFDKAMPDWGKPKFKSKKAPRQGFKTDRAKIVKGKLRLDKPRGITNWCDIRFKGAKSLDGDLKVVSIYRENGKYWASLPFEADVVKKVKTNQKTAVDLNVGHFDYTEGQVKTLPRNLSALYKRIKHYQRLLARKRMVNGKNAVQSNNYAKTKAKLQRDYRRVANIQRDIIQKFTTKLVTDYDKIAIEDLTVKQMQMSHVASKGLHRSLFGYFRQVLDYKCQWYGKELFLADKFYPSTQRCSRCGFVKTGEDKIGLDGNMKRKTKHNEYICYECGAIMGRDENAVMNLLALI
ncbi:RNA-guided endonuclease InsQ/TnpB family protein [Ligilactobacillus ruminis]|uniref:RNA-guided endonuclease InsQ/TnpB family protein n=2 Tax=Ligilactobacillus ruminis TaxID=1623 RepID=UPI0009BC2EAC|nr:RNA-guided endonuclease TnpB family protein [Ligilactobacillus ruminis]MDD5958072.1 transposase [Ligilactobacillus ruminis]MDD6171364.1 transposase [Ligilactobacillus ruminis]NME32762.1 IS200/IS605 family element transposase accessory protein TnpB [Ligilactobacillus ruminis]WKB70461.1 transposase [Ligilactobacillus ruminis]